MYFFLYKLRVFTDFLWNFYKLKEVWVFTDKTGKYYTVCVLNLKYDSRCQNIREIGIGGFKYEWYHQRDDDRRNRENKS